MAWRSKVARAVNAHHETSHDGTDEGRAVALSKVGSLHYLNKSWVAAAKALQEAADLGRTGAKLYRQLGGAILHGWEEAAPLERKASGTHRLFLGINGTPPGHRRALKCRYAYVRDTTAGWGTPAGVRFVRNGFKRRNESHKARPPPRGPGPSLRALRPVAVSRSNLLLWPTPQAFGTP